MKKKSLLTMVLALALVGAVGIGATLAYLSSTTTTLTNTFSVGDVDITQDESDESTPDPDDRTDKGNTYDDIQPGDTLKKDPTVTVLANSSDCYVFMQLTGADALEAKNFTFNGIPNNSWTKVSGEEGKLDGVYQYNQVVTKNAEDQKLAPLFDSVTYSKDATEVDDADLGAVTIKSCAVQEANMTAAEALAAANTEMAK